jgi:ketosteroid isomerase-like protein
VSRHNVDLTRRLLEAVNQRDIEAGAALCDLQIELDSAVSEVGGIYRGHDGLRRYFQDLEDAWGDEVRREPEAYFDLGEHTLMLYVVHTRGRQSGVELAQPAAVAAKWRDGLCVHVKNYAHKEDALSDLGVSEDALEPIAP